MGRSISGGRRRAGVFFAALSAAVMMAGTPTAFAQDGGSPSEPCYPSCPTPEPSVTPSSSPRSDGGEVLSTELFSPGRVEVRDPGSSVLPFTGGDYVGLVLLGLLLVAVGAVLVRTVRSRE